MPFTLKHAMLTGASLAFLSLSGVTFTSSAHAGPLLVTPKQDVAPQNLTQAVQFNRRGRVVRHRVVRHGGVRYRGVRYHRGYRHNAFPAAALGLFAGVLGAAALGASTTWCDPYYYTWNHCGPHYPAYYGGYSPVYYGGYYPAYGAYPVYRQRVVRYRNVYRPRVVHYRGVQRPRVIRYRGAGPRVVHYRGAGPRAHFIGSRTTVRSGYVRGRGRR